MSPPIIETKQLTVYYGKHRIVWSDVLILLAAAAVFLLLAFLAFERRNLTVGAWPWQRNMAK